MFRGFVLSLGLAYCAVAVAQIYVFPIDRNTVDRNSGSRLVSDEAIVAAIPALANMQRLRTCISSTEGSSGTIEFAPTVTGPHTALMNRLYCAVTPTSQFIAAMPGQMSCGETPPDQRAVVFDRDPAEYFWLGNGVPLDDALEVFRAFRDETIEYENIEPRLRPNGRLLSQVTTDARGLLVGFAQCGCSWRIHIERRENRFVASRLLGARCHH